MTEPNPPSGSSPLRVGGFVLLGVAAVAAVVGLVSLAGGGESVNAAQPEPSAAAAAPSSAPATTPGPPLAAGPPPPAPGRPPNVLSLPPPAGQPALPPAPVHAPPAPAPNAAPPPAPNAAPPAPGPNGAPPAPVHAPNAAPPAPAPNAAPPAPNAAPPAPAPNAVPPAAPAPAHRAAPELPGAGLPPAGDSEKRSSGGGTKSVTKAPVRVYNNSLVKDLAQRAAEDFRGSGWKVAEVGNYPGGNIPTSTVYYRSGTGEESAAESLASNFGMRALPRFAGLKDATPGLIVIVTKDYQRR